jgi:hypothetical protein
MAAGKCSNETAGQSPGRQIISMPTVKITANNHVAEIALHNAEVKQECVTTGPEAPARRIVLRDAEMEVRLHLSWASTARERKRLVERLSRRDHAEVSLGGPILAIDAIRRPAAWPADQEPTPVAALAVAPGSDWSEQPMPTQRGKLERGLPNNVLRIQPGLAGYPPLDLPYDQIDSVQVIRNRLVLVTVRLNARHQPVGAVLIGSDQPEIIGRLAEELNQQRVRRLSVNSTTKSIELLPHSATGQATPARGTVVPWIDARRSDLREALKFAAEHLTPDQIEASLMQRLQAETLFGLTAGPQQPVQR